jgi:mRNA interferase RelE/StbE
MAYNVLFEEDALKQFNKLDKAIKDQITKKLDKLKELDNPNASGEPLKHNKVGLWRYRVNNYRLICEINNKNITILVLVIGRRSVVYN